MLQLQEKAIVMGKDDLFHDTVVFYHFKYFDDVKILIQFLFSLVELIVLFCRFDAPKLLFTTTITTPDEVHYSHACSVREFSLV